MNPITQEKGTGFPCQFQFHHLNKKNTVIMRKVAFPIWISCENIINLNVKVKSTWKVVLFAVRMIFSDIWVLYKTSMIQELQDVAA